MEIESRPAGGAPTPTSAASARFQNPVTRWNSGSSARVWRIAGDGIAEADETYSVVLANADAATDIVQGSAAGIIRDDDDVLSVAAVDADHPEGAAGARTSKMHQGHRGANHPVKRLADGVVEITSMNHGFAVDKTSLPTNVEQTHVSLFDDSNCGIALTDKPVFSVQYHPEAAAGPHDAAYLFERFVELMEVQPSARALRGASTRPEGGR